MSVPLTPKGKLSGGTATSDYQQWDGNHIQIRSQPGHPHSLSVFSALESLVKQGSLLSQEMASSLQPQFIESEMLATPESGANKGLHHLPAFLPLAAFGPLCLQLCCQC